MFGIALYVFYEKSHDSERESQFDPFEANICQLHDVPAQQFSQVMNKVDEVDERRLKSSLDAFSLP